MLLLLPSPPHPIPSSSNAKELGMSYRLTTFDNSTFHHSTPGAVRKIASVKKARRRKNCKNEFSDKISMFLALITLKFQHKILIALRLPQFEPASWWRRVHFPRGAKFISKLEARESFSICLDTTLKMRTLGGKNPFYYLNLRHVNGKLYGDFFDDIFSCSRAFL